MAPPNGGSGRPRDPLVEDRVRQAACRLYGDVGWSGFSIDAVAKASQVGKSSIYLRWPGQTALLLDAIKKRIDVPYDTDTGSLRGDLLVLSRSIYDLLRSDVGDVLVRLSAEARAVPELAPGWAEFVAAQVAAMRAIGRRGVARGEITDDCSMTLMLDALFGGMLMHHMTVGPDSGTDARVATGGYPDALVDMLLSATSKP